MAHVALTLPAQEDLDEIWRYVAQDNRPAADQLVHRIHGQCQLYATQPAAGTLGDRFQAGLRYFSVGELRCLLSPRRRRTSGRTSAARCSQHRGTISGLEPPPRIGARAGDPRLSFPTLRDKRRSLSRALCGTLKGMCIGALGRGMRGRVQAAQTAYPSMARTTNSARIGSR